MAWRMKIKLPKLQITQRQTGSAVRRSVTPRGLPKANHETETTVKTSTDHEANSIRIDTSTLDQNEDVENQGARRLHEIKQIANAESWGKIREHLLKAAVESSILPPGQSCSVCANCAQYRCVDCGPTIYYCEACLGDSHLMRNIFHCAEIWEVRIDLIVMLSLVTFTG